MPSRARSKSAAVAAGESGIWEREEIAQAGWKLEGSLGSASRADAITWSGLQDRGFVGPQSNLVWGRQIRAALREQEEAGDRVGVAAVYLSSPS